MNEAKHIEMRRWLIKGQHDLGSARRLMEGDEPFLDTAVYHCQQAAEKALKAFLTHHEIGFEKTHDLTELIGVCSTVEPGFESWREMAEELTPYAVHFRYPAEILEPERGEAEQAVKHAQGLIDFVSSLLPQ